MIRLALSVRGKDLYPNTKKYDISKYNITEAHLNKDIVVNSNCSNESLIMENPASNTIYHYNESNF